MKYSLKSICSEDPDCFPVGGRISGGVDGGFVACVSLCVCAQLVCSCVVFEHTVDSLPEIPPQI